MNGKASFAGGLSEGRALLIVSEDRKQELLEYAEMCSSFVIRVIRASVVEKSCLRQAAVYVTTKPSGSPHDGRRHVLIIPCTLTLI